MALKRMIKRLLPAYRAAEQVNGRIDCLLSKVEQFEKECKTIQLLNSKIDYYFLLSQRLIDETEKKTLKRIMNNLPSASGLLRKIQLGENIILQRIKKICDENNIHFFLSDGTLIGAERHHGFIPWDDDIDISIMRDEYEKFEKAITDDDVIELKHYYCYFNHSVANVTNKVKFKNSDSFFVDVFVYDYIECTHDEVSNVWESYNEISLEFHKNLAEELEKQGLTDFDISGSYIPRSIEMFNSYYKSLYSKYRSKVDRIGTGEYFCLGFEVSNAFINKIKMLECKHLKKKKKNSIEFEGEKYDCLNNHIDYLSIQYGDIWQFPQDITSQHLREIGTLTKEDISILNNYTKKVD